MNWCNFPRILSYGLYNSDASNEINISGFGNSAIYSDIFSKMTTTILPIWGERQLILEESEKIWRLDKPNRIINHWRFKSTRPFSIIFLLWYWKISASLVIALVYGVITIRLVAHSDEEYGQIFRKFITMHIRYFLQYQRNIEKARNEQRKSYLRIFIFKALHCTKYAIR